MRKAIAFVHLIASTLILSIIVLPISLIDRRGEVALEMSRWWARAHLIMSGIGVRLKGLENLGRPPYIFMGNHQSALDIYALFAVLPPSFRWIAKRELFSIPIFGWALGRAGHISVDRANAREAVKAMERAASNIRAGTTIVMFPEGTRSRDGRLLPFKRGSFSLAFKARVPVVPFAIVNSGLLQPVGHFIPERTGTIEIRIGTPINVEESSKDKLMEMVRAAIEGLLSAGGGTGTEGPAKEAATSQTAQGAG
jgi:1-acyl-sn-glycerol-3-phosphate acyltransferase